MLRRSRCGLAIGSTRDLNVVPAEKPLMHKLLFGRQRIVEHKMQKTPTLAHALLQCEKHELKSVMKSALVTRKLTDETLGKIIVKCGEFGRLDRARAIAKHYGELEPTRHLNHAHYAALMNVANQVEESGIAMDLWAEMRADKNLHPTQAGYTEYLTALATYRRGKATMQWREALDVYTEMCEEEVPLTATMLATLMSISRRGPWEFGLSLYAKHCGKTSSDTTTDTQQTVSTVIAVSRGAAQGSGLLLQQRALLSHLEFLSSKPRCPLPNCWEVALRMVQATDDICDYEVVDFNHLFHSFVRTASRRVSLKLFEAFKKGQFLPGVRPNERTFDILLKLLLRGRGRKPLEAGSAIIANVIEEMFAEEVQVPARVYQALFDAFHREGHSDRTLAYVEEMERRAMVSPGNTLYDLESVYVGLLDALLVHPTPLAANALLKKLSNQVESVLPELVHNLGMMGDPTQRWVVGGRVAVPTSLILRRGEFETLSEHYDSIIVPFTSVRRTVEQGISPLAEALSSPFLKSHTRVFPLTHQLQANAALSGESVTEVEDSAVLEELERSNRAAVAAKKKAITIRHSYLVSASQSGRKKTEDHSQSLRPAKDHSRGARDHGAVVLANENTRSTSSTSQAPLPVKSALFGEVAVAKLLQSLNPDATVHLVVPEFFPADEEKKLRDQFGVKVVRFLTEFSTKAPSPLQHRDQLLEKLQHRLLEESRTRALPPPTPSLRDIRKYNSGNGKCSDEEGSFFSPA